MIAFILGIILFIAFLIYSFAFKDMSKTWKTISRILACAVLLIFLALSCVSYVPTGYTGIITTFGKVHNETLDAGINIHAPWDAIIKMDNREQKISFELQAFSADIQEVSIKGSVNLNIDKKTAMNLYREVGTDYLNILAMPRILEDVKTIFSHYSAENLIAQRNVLSTSIAELLRQDLGNKGLNIISVAIEDVDFSDAYTNSVEAKQVATQEKQRAQTEQEQKTMEATQAAERKKIEAQAAAEVQKIEADAAAYAVRIQAEAQAEANKKLSESITEELIKYNYVQEWDGKLPVVSGETTPILNLTDLK